MTQVMELLKKIEKPHFKKRKKKRKTVLHILRTLMEKEKMVAEGAGALSVAAVLFNKIPLQGKNVVCVVSLTFNH